MEPSKNRYEFVILFGYSFHQHLPPLFGVVHKFFGYVSLLVFSAKFILVYLR